MFPTKITVTLRDRELFSRLGATAIFEAPSTRYLPHVNDRKAIPMQIALNWAIRTGQSTDIPPDFYRDERVQLNLALPENNKSRYGPPELSALAHRAITKYYASVDGSIENRIVDRWEDELTHAEWMNILEEAFRLDLDPRQVRLDRFKAELKEAMLIAEADGVRRTLALPVDSEAVFLFKQLEKKIGKSDSDPWNLVRAARINLQRGKPKVK